MITIRNPNTNEWHKQKHFDRIEENVKTYGYQIKPEEFYHPGYQQWFTSNNWVIWEKSNFLRRKKLFTFRYSEGTLTIVEYKKQNFQKIKDAAAILFGSIDGLNCIIENLYCFDIHESEQIYETKTQL